MKKTIIASSKFRHRGVLFEAGDEFDFTVFPKETIKILRNLLRAKRLHFGEPVRTIDEVLKDQGYEFDENKWLVTLKNVVVEEVSDESGEEDSNGEDSGSSDDSGNSDDNSGEENENPEGSDDNNGEEDDGESKTDEPTEEELANIEALKNKKNRNKK